MGTGVRTIGVGACLLGAASATWPHEMDVDALPDVPGWRVGAAAALVLGDGDGSWPVPRRPGVLLTGHGVRDMRGALRLEHAVFDGAVRVDRHQGAVLALGVHHGDKPHVETARWTGRWPMGTDEIRIAVGRSNMPLGEGMASAGHFDRFAQPPLAKWAAFDSYWIDDGLTVAWRRAGINRGVQTVEAGIWRGRAFPGATNAKGAPSLRVQSGWDHWSANLFVARARPRGRGAAVVTAGQSGHVHRAPDCRDTLQQLVCFDGTADIGGASLTGASEDEAWQWTLAGLVRRERGSLYSLSGDASLDSRLVGVWGDVAWQFQSGWTVAVRAERLVPRNDVSGIGAALLASEAGLSGAGNVHRIAVALINDVLPDVSLAGEAATERGPHGPVSHIAVRLIWRMPQFLEGRW